MLKKKILPQLLVGSIFDSKGNQTHFKYDLLKIIKAISLPNRL